MKKITVYHGSTSIIADPVYGGGSLHNDYGPGFYLTVHEEMAKEWACARDRDGFANQYTLETDGLSMLYLTRGDYHILNWLAVLLENRTFRVNSDLMEEGRRYVLEKFLPPYRRKDVIVGYRADDSYFSFAGLFLGNAISLAQLEQAMALGEMGEQIVLKSRKAFTRLHFIRALPASRSTYYPLASGRDHAARQSFRKLRGDHEQAYYLIDILREGWDNEDERLQRIVLR